MKTDTTADQLFQEMKFWEKPLDKASLQASDFEDAETPLWSDFRSLCSALQDSWKEMCAGSEALLNDSGYMRRMKSGRDFQVNVGHLPVNYGLDDLVGFWIR